MKVVYYIDENCRNMLEVVPALRDIALFRGTKDVKVAYTASEFFYNTGFRTEDQDLYFKGIRPDTQQVRRSFLVRNRDMVDLIDATDDGKKFDDTFTQHVDSYLGPQKTKQIPPAIETIIRRNAAYIIKKYAPELIPGIEHIDESDFGTIVGKIDLSVNFNDPSRALHDKIILAACMRTGRFEELLKKKDKKFEALKDNLADREMFDHILNHCTTPGLDSGPGGKDETRFVIVTNDKIFGNQVSRDIFQQVLTESKFVKPHEFLEYCFAQVRELRAEAKTETDDVRKTKLNSLADNLRAAYLEEIGGKDENVWMSETIALAKAQQMERDKKAKAKAGTHEEPEAPEAPDWIEDERTPRVKLPSKTREDKKDKIRPVLTPLIAEGGNENYKYAMERLAELPKNERDEFKKTSKSVQEFRHGKICFIVPEKKIPPVPSESEPYLVFPNSMPGVFGIPAPKFEEHVRDIIQFTLGLPDEQATNITVKTVLDRNGKDQLLIKIPGAQLAEGYFSATSVATILHQQLGVSFINTKDKPRVMTNLDLSPGTTNNKQNIEELKRGTIIYIKEGDQSTPYLFIARKDPRSRSVRNNSVIQQNAREVMAETLGLNPAEVKKINVSLGQSDRSKVTGNLTTEATSPDATGRYKPLQKPDIIRWHKITIPASVVSTEGEITTPSKVFTASERATQLHRGLGIPILNSEDTPIDINAVKLIVPEPPPPPVITPPPPTTVSHAPDFTRLPLLDAFAHVASLPSKEEYAYISETDRMREFKKGEIQYIKTGNDVEPYIFISQNIRLRSGLISDEAVFETVRDIIQATLGLHDEQMSGFVATRSGNNFYKVSIPALSFRYDAAGELIPDAPPTLEKAKFPDEDLSKDEVAEALSKALGMPIGNTPAKAILEKNVAIKQRPEPPAFKAQPILEDHAPDISRLPLLDRMREERFAPPPKEGLEHFYDDPAQRERKALERAGIFYMGPPSNPELYLLVHGYFPHYIGLGADEGIQNLLQRTLGLKDAQLGVIKTEPVYGNHYSYIKVKIPAVTYTVDAVTGDPELTPRRRTRTTMLSPLQVAQILSKELDIPVLNTPEKPVTDRHVKLPEPKKIIPSSPKRPHARTHSSTLNFRDNILENIKATTDLELNEIRHKRELEEAADKKLIAEGKKKSPPFSQRIIQALQENNRLSHIERLESRRDSKQLTELKKGAIYFLQRDNLVEPYLFVPSSIRKVESSATDAPDIVRDIIQATLGLTDAQSKTLRIEKPAEAHLRDHYYQVKLPSFDFYYDPITAEPELRPEFQLQPHPLPASAVALQLNHELGIPIVNSYDKPIVGPIPEDYKMHATQGAALG